jgi:nitrogen regulatory protein PII
MKLVVAMIRPAKCAAVQAALADLGLSQLTLSEVWGQGHEPGQTYIYRGTTFQEARLKRIKIEIAVDDEMVDAVVEGIRQHAMTGSVGDGVILVSPIDAFVRIRTGQYERGGEKVTNRYSVPARVPRSQHGVASASR